MASYASESYFTMLTGEQSGIREWLSGNRQPFLFPDAIAAPYKKRIYRNNKKTSRNRIFLLQNDKYGGKVMLKINE